MKYYILFNPLAGSGSCKSKMDALTIDGSDCVYYDVTDGGYGELLKELDTDDKIVICGGGRHNKPFLKRHRRYGDKERYPLFCGR